MSKYKIGQKVEIIRGREELLGMVGTVVINTHPTCRDALGVRLPERVWGVTHNIGGDCPDEDGYWVMTYEIKPLPKNTKYLIFDPRGDLCVSSK